MSFLIEAFKLALAASTLNIGSPQLSNLGHDDNIAELEAANIQLEAAKVGFKVAANRDTTLGNISTMPLESPSSSGVVEEPAAVHAARLAQLAAKACQEGR